MSILYAIEWNISPEIFDFGFLQIRYYGLLFAIGFMTGFYIIQKYYRDANQDPLEVDSFLIYTIIGGILGARLGHILFYEFDYYASYPSEILKVWHGGLASHGGVIGVLISTYIFSRKYKKPFLWIADRLAMPAAFIGGLIRLGNLMNSEIYGPPTDLPWGFIFRINGETIAKHPTQIYEALAYFAIAAFIWWAYNKENGKIHFGKLTGYFLALVFTARFFIEFIKNNQESFEDGMLLNMGQLLSIPIVAIGIYLITSSKNKPNKLETQAH